MSESSGPLVEGDISTVPETDALLLEDEEFAAELVDSGCSLAELADWCDENNVPREIALELMKRAIDGGQSFIIY